MSLLPITIEQTNQVLEALPEDQQFFARPIARTYPRSFGNASACASGVYFYKSVIRTFWWQQSRKG